MRIKHLLACLALAGIAAASAGTAWPPGPGAMPPITFSSPADLWPYVVVDRQLGDPSDAALLARLQADSQIRHLQGPASERLAVVQVDLLAADGGSRARSPDGNFVFYVLRESPRGMRLLGRMFGRRYKSRLVGGHLELTAELQRSGLTVPMRFRVDSDTLMDLSPLPPHAGDGRIAGRLPAAPAF